MIVWMDSRSSQAAFFPTYYITWDLVDGALSPFELSDPSTVRGYSDMSSRNQRANKSALSYLDSIQSLSIVRLFWDCASTDHLPIYLPTYPPIYLDILPDTALVPATWREKQSFTSNNPTGHNGLSNPLTSSRSSHPGDTLNLHPGHLACHPRLRRGPQIHSRRLESARRAGVSPSSSPVSR